MSSIERRNGVTTIVSSLPFQLDDGGRAAAGFKGVTGDCVVRAIAVAGQLEYQDVYDELFERSRVYIGRTKARLRDRNPSPRTGTYKAVFKSYLLERGWTWTPTMKIGQGCKVHLRVGELPMGRLVVVLSRHLSAVVNGVLHDTYDCSRRGTRCVYGYFAAPGEPR